MSITQRARNATRTAAAYQLRLHGGTEDERLIDVPPGKHSIGSGPRCQIRLQAEGVGAMECLLVCDRAGLKVRRWSDQTLLNGQPFEEAALAAGDVLTVGAIELAIVAPGATEAGEDRSVEPDSCAENRLQTACDAIDDIFLADEGPTGRSPSPGGWEDDRPSRPTQRIARPASNQISDSTTSAANANALTKSAVRRRSRRALAVIRRQRHDHDELLGRVDELEQMLAQAIAQSTVVQPTTTPTASEVTAAPQVDAAADERVASLEGELDSLQAKLGGREAELQQARYSIDALERQLIDSQHTMNAFADERVHWEQQFNEIEARLAKYSERIQELEEQLESSQSQPIAEQVATVANVSETGIDWESELGPLSGSTSSDEPAAEADVESDEHVAVATAVEEEPVAAPSSDYDWHADVVEPATETSESDVETAVAPLSEAAAESIDVTEGNASLAAESDSLEGVVEQAAPSVANSDVEQALEHLRGISIWRESPAGDTDKHDDGHSNGVSSSTEPRESSAPESFLDRYAHMFPQDDAELPATAHEDSTVSLKEAVPPPDVHADEESVEQYMAKLLDRMRGGPAGGLSSHRDSPQSARAIDTRREPISAPAEEAVEERPKFIHLDEMKTRAAAPEQPSDMAAMRALANQSARQALSLHAARKLRRTAITRVIVTALAASVAVYLLLNSATWRSLSFAAGCAAAFASLYWGMLTMGTLLKGFQLGAFDEYDEELTDEKSLNPPLPIDVEQSSNEVMASATEQPPTSDSAATRADQSSVEQVVAAE